MSHFIPYKDFKVFWETYTLEIARVLHIFEHPVMGKTSEVYHFLKERASFERFKTCVKTVCAVNDMGVELTDDSMHGLIVQVVSHYFEKDSGGAPRKETLVKYLQPILWRIWDEERQMKLDL